MINRLIILAVFIAGLSIGWLGNSWLASGQLTSASSVTIANGFEGENAASQSQNTSADNTQPAETGIDDSIVAISNSNNTRSINTQRAIPESRTISTGASVTDIFGKLISNRQYQAAINLYEEQYKQNTKLAAHLRINLMNHLKLLTEARSNSDFSELIESYLSIYYDDVDFLLLLADFNQANGSYLEVVDVYLLAKTYAYTNVDQQNTLSRFNNFVTSIDQAYTSQQDWWSLINFYTHVNTSGLMTSTHQYQQALAHLRSGDEYFAIEQFTQLLNDSMVGESAALALNSLDNNGTASAIENNAVQDDSQSVVLQKIGNQYAVNLSNNRRDNVNLLIDTGASMTVISSSSFFSLGIGADAVELDRRVFRTAGGVVMGTVYAFPELRLGPYLLQDTQVAVLDFETRPEIDGLLGMNILGQFRFQIDQENTQLRLSKK